MRQIFPFLIVLVSVYACNSDRFNRVHFTAPSDATVADTVDHIRTTGTVSGSVDSVPDTESVDGAGQSDAGSPDAIHDTKTSSDSLFVVDTVNINDALAETNDSGDDRLVIDVSIGQYPSRIITAGTKNNPVLDIVFPGTDEPVSVQSLWLRVRGSHIGVAPTTVRGVAVYDNPGLQTGKPFCEKALAEDGWVGCNDERGLFDITGETKIVVKVNIDEVFSPEKNGPVSGEAFSVGFNSDVSVLAHNFGGFVGVGKTSGKKYTTGRWSKGSPVPTNMNLEGNTMYVYKTKPTFATVALGTNVLINGEQTLAVIGLTVDSNGDLGISRLTYGLNLNNVGAFGSLKLYIGGSRVDAHFEAMYYKGSYDLGASTVKGLYNGYRLLVDLSKEVTFSGGSYTLIEVRGTVEGVTAGSEVGLGLIGNGGPYPAHTAIGLAKAFIADAITWSDHSDSNHSTTSYDWIGGQLIPPTTSSILSQ